MKLATTTDDFSRYYPEHTERIKAIADAGFKYIDLSFYAIDKINSPFMLENFKEYVEQLKGIANELGVK